MDIVARIKKYCERGNIVEIFDSLPNDINVLFYNRASELLSQKIGNITLLKSILAKRGKVYIGSFSRGVAHPHLPGVTNINVTSGSSNKIDKAPAKEMSPMYLGPVNNTTLHSIGKTTPVPAKLFENFWQYGKVFPELGQLDKDGNVNAKWVAFRSKGYAENKGHRHPKGTKTKDVITRVNNTNRYRYMLPAFGRYFNGENYDYINSRKNVYVPVYESLVSHTQAYINLKRKVDNGESVMILDLDGPRDGPNKVTSSYLRSKINDSKSPFGHGYVIAGMLSGIHISQYIS
jgi:hypothetical protein